MRTPFLNRLPLAVLIAFMLAFGSWLPEASASKRPNVVFIFIDDQGYYDLGCYGATEVNTPRIDALAEKGIRFTNFYSAAPICSPSRAGLLTGLYPRRTGNHVWVHRPESTEGIPSEVLTVSELFKTAGYATACIGKWHLGFDEESLPWNQGFDYYYGILHNLDSFEVSHFDDEGGMPLQRNREVLERGTSPDHLTEMYTTEAISWIEEKATKGDEPFFLYLPHTMLHDPLGVSEKFKGSSNWGEYGDAIQEMDYNVGRIVDALERLEIDDETLVIYMSDNGRWPGRNKDQPLVGSKLTTFEGGMRVPCIAYGPGLGVKGGLESTTLAHAMDWYPTLASIAGIKIPEGMLLDGRDLSAMMLGEVEGTPAFDRSVSLNAEVPLRRIVDPSSEWAKWFTEEEYLNAFFYHGSHGELTGVRYGDWKLVLGRKLQLFNLKDDPKESIPLRAPWLFDDKTPPQNPADRKFWMNGRMQSKLRGMIVQFQREMSRGRMYWNE
ncbi:sulfatase family protein [Pelagicoccus mobilis]|uniref:Sulfatase n=1 Tax=Pelagicoccus mobilis TaxID=415221 RepID=A0A934RY38_9BACT|nr:sulfatase [Pelagicoccus mobilis]MBK1876477.1 sulfatase [Pelagicoccus mobilis]